MSLLSIDDHIHYKTLCKLEVFFLLVVSIIFPYVETLIYENFQKSQFYLLFVI